MSVIQRVAGFAIVFEALLFGGAYYMQGRSAAPLVSFPPEIQFIIGAAVVGAIAGFFFGSKGKDKIKV